MTTPGLLRMADMRERLEPVPRRIRGLRNGHVVVDTVRALYAWDTVKYPHYLIPRDDIAAGHLVDQHRTRRLHRGRVHVHGLAVDGLVLDDVARVYADDSGAVAGLVRIDWDALDWFEEDEPLLVHPRNPYTRVDALRSSRHVEVAVNGHVLAESAAPVLVFETGLPTRYYFDRTDVDFTVLTRTDTASACPYKGETSDYYTVRVGEVTVPDAAWSYRQAFGAVAAIAGLIAFFNDLVDTTVDGVLAGPVTDLSQSSGRRTPLTSPQPDPMN